MADKTFLAVLFREFFQTEESGRRHCLLTAKQLGEIPPAKVLRQGSEQSGKAIKELAKLASKHALPRSRTGVAVGKAFSMMRNRLGDFALSKEKTYRGTLLGMRHGYDVVLLIRQTARLAGEREIAEWCTQWLRDRKTLIDKAAKELNWFAANPDDAMAPAKQGLLDLGARKILRLGARGRQTIREQQAAAA